MLRMFAKSRMTRKELITAIEKGNDKAVREFVTQHPYDTDSLNQPVDSQHICPLSLAIMKKHTGIALFLMSCRDIQLNRKDSLGRTPLMHACLAQNRDIVLALLNHPDCIPTLYDAEGNNVLAYATHAGMVDLIDNIKYHLGIYVKKLQPPAPVIAFDMSSIRPMQFLDAACKGQRDTVLAYVHSNARIQNHHRLNVTDSFGRTALNCAIQYGHIDLAIELLETRHIDPKVADNDGISPLLSAIMQKNIRLVSKLTAYGAWVASTEFFLSPLYVAVQAEDVMIVRHLLMVPFREMTIPALERLEALAQKKGLLTIAETICAKRMTLLYPGELHYLHQLTGVHRLPLPVPRSDSKVETPSPLALPHNDAARSGEPAPESQTSALSFRERLRRIHYKGDIPEYLEDIITQEIINTPITIPQSGITYDLDSLKNYCDRQKKYECLVTRIEFKPEVLDLPPSMAVKKALESFVSRLEAQAKKARMKQEKKAALVHAGMFSVSGSQPMDVSALKPPENPLKPA